MKHTHIAIMAAAIVPLVATAGDKDLANWNYEGLKDSNQVSEIIGRDMVHPDGSKIGVINDVAFNSDGEASLVVAPGTGGADAVQRAEETGFEGRHSMTDDPATRDDTNYQATDDIGRTAPVGATESDRVALVEFQDVNLDSNVVTVPQDEPLDFGYSIAAAGADRAMDTVAISETRGENSSIEEQTRPIANREAPIGAENEAGFRGESDGTGENTMAQANVSDEYVLASDMIGMEVNLAEDDSFGSVEEVLVTNGEAKALVVDYWEGTDKHRIALPANLDAVNSETGELDLDWTVEEVRGLDEFEI